MSGECPLEPDQLWGEASIPFRPPPIKDVQDDDLYLGWLPEYQACESNGYSTTAGGYPGSQSRGVTFYNYNYAWNAEVGLRSFWEKKENGNGKRVSWFQSCPYGYERSSYWWSAKCQIPSELKFLGETCTDKYQCVHGFTDKYIDSTCSPVSADPNSDWKCVFDEESGGGISLDNDICSCFGLLWCESDDCGGNQCVLSTYDMNKHCKYEDEPVISSWLGLGVCSNCRTSDNACIAFDGDAANTDTSQIGIEAGIVGIGCAALLGTGYAIRKIAKRRSLGPKSYDTSMETEMVTTEKATNAV